MCTKVLPFLDPQCKLKIPPLPLETSFGFWFSGASLHTSNEITLFFSFQFAYCSASTNSLSLFFAFQVFLPAPTNSLSISDHHNKFALTFWPFRHSWPRPNLHTERAFQLITGHSASNCTYCVLLSVRRNVVGRSFQVEASAHRGGPESTQLLLPTAGICQSCKIF